MIYGLISDIHGNLEALEAVLAELAGVDAFLCLGDIVGYGADPGQCVDRVRDLPDLTCVAGNHDLAAIGRYDLSWFNPLARAAIQWTDENLSSAQKAYLSSLQETARVADAFLVHGSYPETMDYITAPQDARRCFDATTDALVLVGHTHIGEHYRARGGSLLPVQTSLAAGGEVDLKPGLRYIINPGAVGQPRDGKAAASFAIWRVEERVVEARRAAYDVERAQDKMRAAGLPPYLAERLARGR